MTSKAVEIKLYAIKALKSDECQCGRSKDPGRSFCYTCYMKLPKDMRKALWKKVGQGYEQAYENACQHLNEEEG